MEKKLDKGKVVWSSCHGVSYGKRTRKFMINKGCYADETCLPSSSLPGMGEGNTLQREINTLLLDRQDRANCL